MVGKKFGVEGVSWLGQVFDMVAARSPNHPPLSLQIPDTVAFRYQRPAALYVNDAVEDHAVSCQEESSHLSADAICQRFVPRRGAPLSDGGGVCAMYVFVDKGGHDAEESPRRRDSDAQNVVVEYMNPPQLRHFLQQRTKENNGILQRFTPSKGVFHTTIRVQWTPRTCQVETRANRHKMDDTRLPVTERLSTFDGGPHLSTSHSLKDGKFYKNIKQAAENIVRHVETLIPRPFAVWETVLYFKYTAPERGGFTPSTDKSGITFLWCSTMRVYKDELLDLRRLDEFWTSEQRTEIMSNKEAPDKDVTVMRCPINGKPYKDGTGTEVQVGTIIKYLWILSQSHPDARVTLEFKQEAADLDENSTSNHNKAYAKSGEEAIKEAISEMFAKHDKAKEACDLIKRVLFGNPEAADASRLREIFHHAMFRQQNIIVSEDTALDCSLVVERESVRVKTQPNATANEAAAVLARAGRKTLKSRGSGAALLAPASVVEVRSILVGADVKKLANARASQSLHPEASKDALPSTLTTSAGTVPKRSTLHSIGTVNNAASQSSLPVHHRRVDLDLGTSRILSFRRLRYNALGGDGAKGRTANGPLPSGEQYGLQMPHQQHGRLRPSGGNANAIDGSVLVPDFTLDERALQSSTAGSNSSTFELTSARGKDLYQCPASAEGAYSRNTSGAHEFTTNGLQASGLFSIAKDELRPDSRKRPPDIATKHDIDGKREGLKPWHSRNSEKLGKIQRPASEYKPRERQHTAYKSNPRPASALAPPRPDRLRPASTIKHYKALDAEWTYAMRDKALQESRAAIDASGRNRLDSLALPPGRKIAAAPPARGLSAGSNRAASAASTRVSSAASARAAAAVQGRRAAPPASAEWSDGDFVEDADEEDWDDGLEMDLPSTHVRLKRDEKSRASKESLRRSREGPPKDDKGKSQMPLCLQWGLNDRVKAKVLNQYAFANP